jgi:hypothetical protein
MYLKNEKSSFKEESVKNVAFLICLNIPRSYRIVFVTNKKARWAYDEHCKIIKLIYRVYQNDRTNYL